VQREHVWGLTTLCLNPFMAATGATRRQAVRGRAEAVAELGAAVEASVVRSQQHRANAGQAEKSAHTMSLAEGASGSDRHERRTRAVPDRR
jgi:hypothetical protein